MSDAEKLAWDGEVKACKEFGEQMVLYTQLLVQDSGATLGEGICCERIGDVIKYGYHREDLFFFFKVMSDFRSKLGSEAIACGPD